MFRLFGRNQKNLSKMTQTDKEKTKEIDKIILGYDKRTGIKYTDEEKLEAIRKLVSISDESSHIYIYHKVMTDIKKILES